MGGTCKLEQEQKRLNCGELSAATGGRRTLSEKAEDNQQKNTAQ